MASHNSKYRVFAWAMLALAIGIFAAVHFWRRGTEGRLLARAERALASNDFRQALELSTRLLEIRPNSLEAARTAAESACRLRQNKQAISLFQKVESAGGLTVSECFLLGDLWSEEGYASKAEAYFKQVIAQDATLHTAQLRLIQLLSIQCRVHEALAHRHQLLRRKVWSTEDLLYMAKPDDLMESPDLDVFLKSEPANPYLLLAKARQAKLLHRFDEAKSWIDRALEVQPGFIEAHVDRGLLLLEQNAAEETFAHWHRDLPEGADQQPDVWVVRGMWAKMCKDTDGAARCFGEALRRAPDHRLATYQLSLALAARGEETLASELTARVSLLDELSRAADDVHDAPASTVHWRRGADLLVSLGRLHEAAAWYYTVGRMTGDNAASAKAQELYARITRDSPNVVAESNPLLKFNFEKYPLPSFASHRLEASSRPSASTNDFRFTEVAHARGIDFVFFGADGPARRARRIFEIFGSGTAIVDFDSDGWPDVYVAQGSPSTESNNNDAYRDQLFWNRAGERFERVTNSACLGDDRFSQGATVGDFNNDGFPDLYVANVGENRLYQNNGDGTYSDVTSVAGIAGAVWTASCVMADLNGDSWPDIYDVTYLGGREIFEILCDDPNSRHQRSCRPRDFPSEPDRFWLNLGDGRFSDCTAQAGFVAPDGKGLGVVVADFDGNGQLSVFVANDTTANHFYCNRSPRGAAPDFENRADLVGLAYDRNGLSQACMGVAVDDADADGDLDLFVTNFFDESNTLYRRAGSQSFEDASRETGLYLPSLAMLGFGTQFLDADLDGDPDLVVTNGHITSEAHDGSEFQMRPQFFENHAGHFVERRAVDVGEYFARKLLGRALVRLDFNRDGREDFAISHLDAPLALLQNDCPRPGNYLSIKLVGTTGDRDAIGTTVTVTTANGRERFRQLTAGDGYQCSNQRSLVFGLGEATSVSRMVIKWPSGTEEHFVEVPGNRELTMIEGMARPY